MGDMVYEKIEAARKLLGVPERATIDEIKKLYRDKMKQYHPDANRHDNDAHWKTLELIKAYEIIVKYCQQYRFSFRKEDLLVDDPRAVSESTAAAFASWWQKHYGDDPLWGRGGIE